MIRQVEQFYARTVDAVEDLREHIYREAAHLLVALHWLPDEARSLLPSHSLTVGGTVDSC